MNRREPDGEYPDRSYAFQAELAVHCATGFVPRPDLRGSLAADWDEQVADLHYSDAPEYATGHGVSADWEISGGTCRLVRTTWIPSAEVERTATVAVEGVELSMEALGALPDGAAADAALRPLVRRYRDWIAERSAEIAKLSATRRETAQELLRKAELATARIERGVAVLAEEADALDAFRLANRAVAKALRQRVNPEKPPAWRAFQLAFILLNLPGIADPADPSRETVDLLFFPTGGGKTEASASPRSRWSCGACGTAPARGSLARA